ncbi:MAG: DUF1565 domain-containing protein [Chloroflexi bacterium]|nr:DUF1565 domain-containing protein [Chloroflexota bacterium]
MKMTKLTGRAIAALFIVVMVASAFPAAALGSQGTTPIYLARASAVPGVINVAGTGNDVTGDGTSANPYRTIQKGIDMASGGDTVLVAAGTYQENLDFKGKAITVKSAGGAENTTIDGGQAGSVVRFVSGETAAAVLDGFTLTNGSGTYVNQIQPFGGGVYSYNGSNPTIINCIITGNTADTGGGVSAWYASATIVNSVIRGNTASGGGGGVTVVNSIIAGNS